MAQSSDNSPDQPDHESVLQKFHTEVQNNLIEGQAAGLQRTKFCSEPFLRRYFEEYNHYNLHQLLKATFKTKHAPLQDIRTKDILDKDHGYVLVFAILLSCRLGKWFKHFYQHRSLCDSFLPFTAIPNAFPGGPKQHEMFEKFRAEQWRFCAARLDSRRNAIWEPERTLPIADPVPLGRGGSANTFRITIHEQYNKMDLGTRSGQSVQTHEYFVLKRYKPPYSQDEYDNELNAFHFISNQSIERQSLESFIGFYGSYVHDRMCNIVLEYANEGTLEDMFQKTPPPETVPQRLQILTSLFGLVNALKILHATQMRSPDNTVYTYLGFHNDIKPENILRKSKPGSSSVYESVTKLADFGLSHFQQLTGTNALGLDAQGTRVYGAPECYYPERTDRSLGREVSNLIDIWSLGCVLLEVLVWMYGGRSELQEFRTKRLGETQAKSRFEDLGAFHDGQRVLDCVQEQILRFQQSNFDELTSAVAAMIKDMLSVNATERPPAAELRGKCNTALSHATRNVELATSPRHGPLPANDSTAYSPTRPFTPSYSSDPNSTHQSIHRYQSDNSGLSRQKKTTKNLPYAKAKVWLEKSRASWNPFHSPPRIEHFDQLHQIKGRDHVFLLDNSESMYDHWHNVRETVELLSEIVWACKADGRIDVGLAMGDEKCHSSHASRINKYVMSHVPAVGEASAEASIQFALGKLLQEFLKDLERKQNRTKIGPWRSDKKPLSLYVLTNGNFPEQDDVGMPIQHTIEAMKRLRLSEDYIGIQFIRFGDDAVGKARLDRLDNLEGQPWDIVDTERWDDNVLKLFLGPINPTFDGDASPVEQISPMGLLDRRLPLSMPHGSGLGSPSRM